jgi:hypothetical protein
MVTFGNACYVVYMSPASASTPTCAVSDPAAVVKSVSVQGVNLTRLDDLVTITFEPVLGSASSDDTTPSTPAVAEVTAPSGKLWKLQIHLSSQGRVKTCSPAGVGFVFGYNSDCGAS